LQKTGPEDDVLLVHNVAVAAILVLLRFPLGAELFGGPLRRCEEADGGKGRDGYEEIGGVHGFLLDEREGFNTLLAMNE